MSAKGFTIPEEGRVVNLLTAIDVGGVAKTADSFNMKNAAHADIIIQSGVIGNTATITVYENTDNAAGGETAIGFDYYLYGASDDTPGTRQTATSSGFATGTTSGSMYVICLDASQLSDGSPYVSVKTSSAAAHMISMVAVLSGCRYVTPNDGGPTSLT